MVYLNYNNLDDATQEQLLAKSKSEVSEHFGKELKMYSAVNQIAYESLLEEEAIKNLYNYKFVFNI